MIDGCGKIQLRSPSGGLFGGGFAQVQIESEVNTAQGRRFNTSGTLVVSDSRIIDTTYTLTLTGEVWDTRALELAIGELAQVSATAPYYEFKEATVPLTAPYEISDVGIVSGNLTSVMVSLFDNGAYNTDKIQRLVPGTPAAGEFLAAAGKITFHSSQAGAPVIYSYLTSGTSKVTIGLENTGTELTSFYFSAKIFSDAFPNGLMLVAPSISKTSRFTFSTEDVPLTENTFEIGTAAGYRKEFHTIML